MSDTGAPWNLPYPLPTDLVRDGADAIKDLAEATATGLDAAGGLVAVKHALFTGTQTNSTAAGGNFAVTSLSVTHAIATAGNKLIISAYLGIAASNITFGNVGIAVMDGSTLIGVGTASGSRTRVGAGGYTGGSSQLTSLNPSVTFVYSPSSTSSRTYTVRAINIRDGTATIYINRNELNSNSAAYPLGSSGLVVQEVKV